MDNERIEQLENTVNELTTKLDEQSSMLEEFVDNYQQHSHIGTDGSIKLSQDIRLNPQALLEIGNSHWSNAITDHGESSEVYRSICGVGLLTGGTHSSAATEVFLEHGTQTNNTFYWGFRPPIYIGTASITSGGSTLTDIKWKWTTNELAGAYLNVYDGSALYTHLIASNTATVITISDTFTFTNADSYYLVSMPIYFGSADYPWRRLYTATDIRFGIGASAGTKVCFIKHGTGTPEASVTAQVGSLYMRLDGGADTTLYVKESGTGNTGWIAK